MNYTGALFRRSSFFIDVFNVILYIDLFLFHEIKARMEEDDALRYFFEDGLPKIEPTQENDKLIVHEACTKKNQIILWDWINKEKFLESNSEELLSEYIFSLYMDMLTNPICDEYMQTTEFANALKILLKDEKIKSVTFYMPFDSDVIYDNIIEAFTGYGSQKIQFMVGNKDNKAEAFVADSYVLENAKDIDRYLKVPHSSQIEVLIPSYEFNLVESRTKIEQLIEQITYERLNLEEEDSVYSSKYNLSIHTIGVPI